MNGSSDLGALVGRWEGTGEGEFPTIDPFRYREELTFTRRDGETSLHYEQRTWLVGGEKDGETSHWESGFLLPQEDGRVQLLNAQASGRVEVLVGKLEADGAGAQLVLKSVLHGHDPRMRATTRVLSVGGDKLTYRVEMATDKVGQVTRHLAARLARVE